jgi:hypothetical protein
MRNRRGFTLIELLYQSPIQSSQKTAVETPSCRFPLLAGGTEPLRGSPREAGGNLRRGANVNYGGAVGISCYCDYRHFSGDSVPCVCAGARERAQDPVSFQQSPDGDCDSDVCAGLRRGDCTVVHLWWRVSRSAACRPVLDWAAAAVHQDRSEPPACRAAIH